MRAYVLRTKEGDRIAAILPTMDAAITFIGEAGRAFNIEEVDIDAGGHAWRRCVRATCGREFFGARDCPHRDSEYTRRREA